MFNPLLAYAIDTDPTQLVVKGPATFTVVASNQNADPSSNPVLIDQIAIEIAIGHEARDLTLDLPTITPPMHWNGPTTTTDHRWRVYTFKPESNYADVGAQGLVFSVGQFTVNAQPGSTTVRITQVSQAGTQTVDLPLVKAQDTWSQATFWPTCPVIPANSWPTLNWVGPIGAHYSISYLNGAGQEVVIKTSGGEPLAYQGTYPGAGDPLPTLVQTTTFYLNVSLVIDKQPPLKQQQQTTVTVEPS